jgi:hypothetical protein
MIFEQENQPRKSYLNTFATENVFILHSPFYLPVTLRETLRTFADRDSHQSSRDQWG